MRLKTAHVILETETIEKLFDLAIDRHYAWITGILVDSDSADVLALVAEEAGYKAWIPSAHAESPIIDDEAMTPKTVFILIRNDLVVNHWTTSGVETNPADVSFESLPVLGKIFVGVSAEHNEEVGTIVTSLTDGLDLRFYNSGCDESSVEMLNDNSGRATRRLFTTSPGQGHFESLYKIDPLAR